MPNSLNMMVTASGGSLDDRDGKLAAGEEARLLTVVGDEVRLGEALEAAALLQRTDDAANPFLLVEEQQVQKVTERRGRLASRRRNSGEGNCCVVDRPT